MGMANPGGTPDSRYAGVDLDRSITPKGVKLAGGYLRKSKEGELDLQRESVTGLAKRHGATIVDWYIDPDRSASRYRVKDREEFDRMIRDVRSGRLNMIIFYDSDRFSRDPAELEDMIDLCDEYPGLAIEHEKGGLDLRTDDGRMMARFMCGRAAAESDATSRREKERHEAIAKAGRPSGGGMRPFGYEPGGMEIRESEAELIRDAVRRVLAGQTVTGIATEWSGTVPTAMGKNLWPSTNLRRLLRSARIAGLREHYTWRVVRNRKAGTRRRVREYAGKYPAKWPAIITEDEHQRIRILIPDEKPTGEAPARVALLSGMLWCGRPECKASDRKLAANKRNGGPGYGCDREGGCGRCGMSRKVMDDWVKEAVISTYESRALTAAVKHETKAKAKGGVDPAVEIEKIEGQLAVLSRDRYVNQSIDDLEYRASREPLQAKLKVAQAKLVKVEPVDALAAAGVDAKTLRRDWPSMTLDRQRALIDGVVDRITLLPGHRGAGNVGPRQRIRIKWKPDAPR